MLWPLLLMQFRMWVIGRSGQELSNGETADKDAPVSKEQWEPCEALIRVSCREVHRLAQRLFEHTPELDREETAAWSALFAVGVADTLSRNITIEGEVHRELLRLKQDAFGIPADEDARGEATHGEGNRDVIMYTPFGQGRLLRKRNDAFSISGGRTVTVTMNLILLDSGATLYRPAPGTTEFHDAPLSEVVQGMLVSFLYFILPDDTLLTLLESVLRRRKR